VNRRIFEDFIGPREAILILYVLGLISEEIIVSKAWILEAFTCLLLTSETLAYNFPKMQDKGAQVRRKGQPQKRMNKLSIILGLVAVVVLGFVATVAVGTYTGKFDIFSPPLEIVANGNTAIIRVPPGGNLQAAVDRANSGDIIELKAGASYSGEIILPNKPLTDYVTIRSSAADRLPEGKRVAPAQADLMAKILARESNPAVSTAAGAHHYRFIGIEFVPNSPKYVYNLVFFGTDKPRPVDVPHHLEIDRSYLHPFRTGVTRRGIGLNSADSVVKNSHIEGFGFHQEETQGICGWSGTRNVKIINNYIEGGAENIMFGGSDPANAELVPTGIEIRDNHLSKPQSWKGKVTVKTLFELKNAKSVLVTGNYFENNWMGSAFRLTVRNQDGGAPFSTIEDVVISDNVINGAGEGINILGKDDTHSSQTLKRLTIANNVFLNIGGPAWEGAGYFIQVANGEEITISNNTSFNTGNIATFYGALPRAFLFHDNIVGHGDYGIHGLTDMRAAQQMFRNNLFVNNKNVSNSDFSFPDGNMTASDFNSVGFVDAANNDLRLSARSRYRGKSTTRADLGSSIHAAATIKK
jgi:hypothetical protein